MLTIRSQYIDADAITPALNQEIWQLYGRAHNLPFAHFSARWQGLDKVALFRERRSNRLVGCIGIRFHDFMLDDGVSIPTLYFGQVYIEPSFRGRLLIQRTVIRFMLRARWENPLRSCFFWTDALSYKPYLVMANNLADYYPHPDKATPARVLALQEAIGKRYYPDSFQAETRTVAKPSNLLNDRSVVITNEDLNNRFIRFYAQRNPGHSKGDGLLLVCPMTFRNLLHFLIRLPRKRRNGDHRLANR